MSEIAQGLRAVFGQATRRMDWIAENLANTRTPGYRAGLMVSGPFEQVLNRRVAASSQRVATDLTQGAIRATERPLDVALQGEGFFVVRSGADEYLTRNGAFERTADGVLTTAAGYHVIGAEGEPIHVPPLALTEDIEVGPDGSLRAGGVVFGTLRVEAVTDEQHLQRVGTTLFQAPPEARRPQEASQVIGRSLEMSNTETFQTLAEMMVLTRAVEAAERTQRAEIDAQRKMIEALS
jgi:flagellar basal-body rod protein FlgF